MINKRKKDIIKNKDQKIEQIKLINNIRGLIKRKQFVLAHEQIDEYINKYSYNCYIKHQLGKLSMKEENFEQAKEYFLMNIENDEDNKYYSMYEMGRIAYFEYDYDNAEYYFKQIVESNHKDKTYAMVELGKVYYSQCKLKEAEEIFLKVINNKSVYNNVNGKHNNSCDFAKIELAEIYLHHNKLNLATQYLESIKNPEVIIKYNIIRGQIESQKGNIEEAKKIFLYEINKKVLDITAKYELSKIELMEKNHQKSIELASQVVNSSDPLHDEAMLIIISNYIELNELEKAKMLIYELLERSPKNINSVYLNMGKICLYEKKYDEAKKYFSKVSSKSKRNYQYAKIEEIYLAIREENLEEVQAIFNTLDKNEICGNLMSKYLLIETYLDSKVNNNIKNSNCYIGNLIYNYDINLVIEHIEKHKYEDKSKKFHTIFSSDIDIYELYNYALENINKDNLIIKQFMDVYLLKYENAGYYKDKTYNYIKVVTLPNTKEIITIYPSDKESIYIDSEQEIKVEENVKIKQIVRESQIDKFNKKYSKFVNNK